MKGQTSSKRSRNGSKLSHGVECRVTHREATFQIRDREREIENPARTEGHHCTIVQKTNIERYFLNIPSTVRIPVHSQSPPHLLNSVPCSYVQPFWRKKADVPVLLRNKDMHYIHSHVFI